MRQQLQLKAIACIVLAAASATASAASIEQRQIVSEAMQRELPVTVILPDSYGANPTNRFPVLYLLHGAGGDHRDWLNRGNVKSLSDNYNFLIVCPTGENAWYFDAPQKPEQKFETHVAKEVVSFLDTQYRTIADRRGRAIAGLSMGGHGALWLAIAHRDVFGAAGSTSGAVDIRPYPNGWQIKDALGDQRTHQDNWESHSVINQVSSLKSGDLALIIDCGTDDGFIKENRELHARLMDRKISHDYTERPGGHDWLYWGKSIKFQALFFNEYFQRTLPSMATK